MALRRGPGVPGGRHGRHRQLGQPTNLRSRRGRAAVRQVRVQSWGHRAVHHHVHRGQQQQLRRGAARRVHHRVSGHGDDRL